MLSWNSLAFSMIQHMLAIWSLVPLPFLNPAWTFESSQLTYCWSLAWRILSITYYAMNRTAKTMSKIMFLNYLKSLLKCMGLMVPEWVSSIKCISLNSKHLPSASHLGYPPTGPYGGPVCAVSNTVNVKTSNTRENEMTHMLNQVTYNMLLEHRKRQARSRGNQGYRQSLEKRLKCSVCHWWWDQSHIFLLRQLMVHAKLLQSCLTLCNPMDCSPPGPSVHGILQGRI